MAGLCGIHSNYFPKRVNCTRQSLGGAQRFRRHPRESGDPVQEPTQIREFRCVPRPKAWFPLLDPRFRGDDDGSPTVGDGL